MDHPMIIHVKLGSIKFSPKDQNLFPFRQSVLEKTVYLTYKTSIAYIVL